MAFVKATPVRILLLAATACFAALWAMTNLTSRPGELPEGWESDRYGVRAVVGGLLLAPQQVLTFRGMEPFTGDDFEMEIFFRVGEYDRFAFGLGTRDACDDFQVVFPIEKRTAFFPPRRVTLAADAGGILVYEDGKPVKKFSRSGRNAACFSVHAISSVLTLEEVRILHGGRVQYRETFRPSPAFGGPFWLFLIGALVLTAGIGIGEKRIAVGYWRLSFEKTASSQFAAVLPFLLAFSLSRVWEWAEMLVAPSIAWMILSRLAFAYRHGRLFGGDPGRSRAVSNFLGILIGLWLLGYGFFSLWGRFMKLPFPPHVLLSFLIGLALLWLLFRLVARWERVRVVAAPLTAATTISGAFFFVGLFFPEPGFRMIWAVAFINIPFAMICLLYRHAESIRFFTWLVLAALGLFVGTLEGAMRVLSLSDTISKLPEEEPFEPHDLLFWVPSGFFSEDADVPGESYSVEKIAFRSGPAALEKSEGVFRILVMGGSNVWGDGVEDGLKTFPSVMSRILNQDAGRPIEVINGGVSGYGSMQVLILLKYYMAEYRPDLAVFYFLWNDTNQRYGSHTQRELYERAASGRYRAAQWAQRWLRRSVLYNGLADWTASFRREMALGKGARLELKKTKMDSEFKKNIEEILAVCRERNIKPVFVVEYQGADHALGYPYQVGDLERTLKEVVAARGAPLLDANEWFYNCGRWEEMMIRDDIMHLSEQGHDRMGRFIASFLKEQGLVP